MKKRDERIEDTVHEEKKKNHLMATMRWPHVHENMKQ
jgi:hypothetical protein